MGTAQLRSFSKLYEGIFDQNVPFYPMLGEHEAIGPGSSQIFRQVFNLKNSDPLGEDIIAYTVSLGNAFFVVFPIFFLTILIAITRSSGHKLIQFSTFFSTSLCSFPHFLFIFRNSSIQITQIIQISLIDLGTEVRPAILLVGTVGM